MSQEVLYYTSDLSFKGKATGTDININSSWIDVNDVFKFHNSTPYIIMAKSGGGKTTLCMDILFKKASEATTIYYVSETTASSVNNAISSIPNVIKSKCTIKNLVKIWQEITSNKDAYYCSVADDSTNNSAINSLSKIYNQLVKDSKLAEEDSKWRTNIFNTYPEVFTTGDDKKSLTWMLCTVGDYLEKTYYNQKVNENTPDNKKEQYDTESKHINQCFVMETLQRIIINITKLYPQTMMSLKENEVAIINGFYSEKPKSILIIDDCTEVLNQFMNDTKNKTIGLDNTMQTVKNVYTSLITSILTRARHCNCIVCIFTHALSPIPCKDNINNIMCFDSGCITEILRSKSINARTKDVLEYMSNRIFNDSKYKYCFVYYNGSTDLNNVYVGKANVHIREEIQYNPVMQNYINIYDAFNNDENINQQESDEDDDDDDLNGAMIIGGINE